MSRICPFISSLLISWSKPPPFSLWALLTVCKLVFLPHSFLFLAVPCGILVPQPGIEPIPPAVNMWSLNHRTTREVPPASLLKFFFIEKNNLFSNSNQLSLNIHSFSREWGLLKSEERTFQSVLILSAESLRWDRIWCVQAITRGGAK